MGSSVEELVAEMRNNPRNVSFSDACKVADAYFGEPRQKGTSHRTWKMPWPGNPRVNLQDDRGKAKAYQVQQLLDAIDHLEAQQKQALSPIPGEQPPRK